MEISMGDLMNRGHRGVSTYLLAICFLVSLPVSTVTANVVLIGRNVTVSFDDVEAKFTPAVKGSGECGSLYLAEPLDACSPLTNKIDAVERELSSPFALIVRGGCTFEDKVRKAQEAGFKAAIVYDNDIDGVLVAMAGNSAGIKIHAVFVSRASGEVLKKYAGFTTMELWIIPSFENSAWSIIAISFICLLAMSAVLATCFFVRRHRIRRERPRAPCIREFHGMSSRLVKAMPSLIFTAVLEDNCTSRTCAICLEDYSVGEKLRILPCRHKFHAVCVDAWLTTWRTFCPICKRDARTNTRDPPASESTPLLSSSPVSISSSGGMSSVRSSLSSTAAIQIGPAPSWTPPGSYTHSFSSTHNVNSPTIVLSRSSLNLRIASSSQRSHTSHLVSPHSVGYPSVSPLNSRHMSSPFIPSSSNGSPSYLGSCSRQQPPPLHCSESAASFSPYASSLSLPGC